MIIYKHIHQIPKKYGVMRICVIWNEKLIQKIKLKKLKKNYIIFIL